MEELVLTFMPTKTKTDWVHKAYCLSRSYNTTKTSILRWC